MVYNEYRCGASAMYYTLIFKHFFFLRKMLLLYIGIWEYESWMAEMEGKFYRLILHLAPLVYWVKYKTHMNVVNSGYCIW